MMKPTRRLKSEFFHRPTAKVARELLNKVLCVRGDHGRVIRARIVETEAYLGLRDRACHSFGGRRTVRNETMYFEGGHTYVYFIYGMHFCLNFVTCGVDEPEAVLVRAVEMEGDSELPKKLLKTNGPGKLCRHLGIGREDDGQRVDSRNSRIWVEEGVFPKPKIVKRARIGVDYAGKDKDRLLRFYVSDSASISKK